MSRVTVRPDAVLDMLRAIRARVASTLCPYPRANRAHVEGNPCTQVTQGVCSLDRLSETHSLRALTSPERLLRNKVIPKSDGPATTNDQDRRAG